MYSIPSGFGYLRLTSCIIIRNEIIYFVVKMVGPLSTLTSITQTMFHHLWHNGNLYTFQSVSLSS